MKFFKKPPEPFRQFQSNLALSGSQVLTNKDYSGLKKKRRLFFLSRIAVFEGDENKG